MRIFLLLLILTGCAGNKVTGIESGAIFSTESGNIACENPLTLEAQISSASSEQGETVSFLGFGWVYRIDLLNDSPKDEKAFIQKNYLSSFHGAEVSLRKEAETNNNQSSFYVATFNNGQYLEHRGILIVRGPVKAAVVHASHNLVSDTEKIQRETLGFYRGCSVVL